MAIGLAFTNVVLRKAAYEQLSADHRWLVRQAMQWRPGWFRMDDHLLATTFTAPADVRSFCTCLMVATGLRLDEDFAVIDLGSLDPLEVPWLLWDISSWGKGYAALTGEREKPLDDLPEWLPRGSTMVQYAPNRDSIRDPLGADGKPHRDPDVPTWGGKGLWFWARPRQSASPENATDIAWDTLDASWVIRFMADLVSSISEKAPHGPH